MEEGILVRKLFKNKANNQISITLSKKFLNKKAMEMRIKPKKIKLKFMGFE